MTKIADGVSFDRTAVRSHKHTASLSVTSVGILRDAGRAPLAVLQLQDFGDGRAVCVKAGVA